MRRLSCWGLVGLCALLGLSSAAQAEPAETVAPSASSGADPAPITASSSAVQLQLDAVYEHLSNGYAPWRSAALGVRAVRAASSLYASLEEATRFSQLDYSVTAGVERRLSPRWTVGGGLQSSPSHHVLPTWGAIGHAAFVAGPGWDVQVDVRHVRYPSTPVAIAALTAERYVSRYRTAYTLYTARVSGGEMSVSHRVHADVYYGARSSSIGVSVSAGQEVERLVPIGVLRSQVRTVAIVGRQWVRATWFLSYDAVLHEQGDFYVRRRISAGVGHRF